MPRRFLNGIDALLQAGAIRNSHLAGGADAITADKLSQTPGAEAVAGVTIRDGAVTDAKVAAGNKDGGTGTASMRTLGSGAQQAAPGNHTHATNYHAHFASGPDINLPNNGVWQRIADGSTELGVGWNMQGVWYVSAQMLVRADSQNWTSVEGRIQLFNAANGATIDAQACTGRVNVHRGASSDGDGWSTIHMSRIVQVNAGQAWMPRLEARVYNAFGAVLSRGYTWTNLMGHRLDHGPGY